MPVMNDTWPPHDLALAEDRRRDLVTYTPGALLQTPILNGLASVDGALSVRSTYDYSRTPRKT